MNALCRHRSAVPRRAGRQNVGERNGAGSERSRWSLPQFCSPAWGGTALRPIVVCLFAGAACLQLLCPAIHAQSATNKSIPATVLLPPLPLISKSPVDFFRELLAMKPAERRQFLTNRPPENQKLILQKVREYESMKGEQRELRLQATELRWYLLPRMSLSPTNRPELEAVPAHIRPLVKNRLRDWDMLPPNLQTQLLTNEMAIRVLTGVESTNLSAISLSQREKLQKGLEQWQQLKEEQRQIITKCFNHFFELNPEEKDKALNMLSEPERRQIERTLRNFGDLTPPQRVRCIRSFESFATMSLEERQQFLKNADRWKLMSPSQRQEWVRIINTLGLEPPMPPRLTPLPMPPPLPKKPVSRKAPVLTTNGN